MANKVLLKKSSVAAKVPLTTDLDYGELALNYSDEKIYFKNASNAIKSFTAVDWTKRSVRVATTANITLSGTQTIDGVAVVAGDRVLVKNQTTASQNGIYVVAAGAWTRAAGADTAAEMVGAVVSVDSGTVNGGLHFDTDFKSTDTLGTTSLSWYRVVDTQLAITSGSTSTDAYVRYAGTTATAGQFDGGTTTPTGTTRLNYGGYFYPTFINLAASGDTATAATHYFVETGSDGFVRPKTLANVRTEIVTSAAVIAGLGFTPSAAGGQFFGSATTKAIAYNSNTIAENVTVTAGNNGLSAGPITISNGFTVTVESGANWVIV